MAVWNNRPTPPTGSLERLAPPFLAVGATTAEKLDGTSRGVDPLPFLPPSAPHSPVIAPPNVSPIPLPTLLSFLFKFSC